MFDDRSGVSFSMRLASFLVARSVEVFDFVPLAADVDIADDLPKSNLGLKLHLLAAVEAIHDAARLDVSLHGAGCPLAFLFSIGRLGFCCCPHGSHLRDSRRRTVAKNCQTGRST